MKQGFTLAEVLITLGVIGVIAALTLPSVINHYQKKATGVQLKKAYSILTNALRMAEVEYSGGTFPLRAELYSGQHAEDELKVFETYFVPYLQGAKKYSGKQYSYKTSSNSYSSGWVKYLCSNHAWCINNGMCFVFMNHGGNYSYILVDLNSPKKGPNKVGRDVFYFAIHFEPDKTIIDGHIFQVYSNTSLDTIYNKACSKTGGGWSMGEGCTEIIMRNNWEIPDDDRYPW